MELYIRGYAEAPAQAFELRNKKMKLSW